MVRLKNIVISERKAEADFYPEDSKIAGHIVVDLCLKEIICCEEVPEFSPSYSRHAARKLISMAAEGNHRTEVLVMWY